MPDYHRPGPAGKVSHSGSPWVVRVSVNLLDHRVLKLTDRQKIMFMILDGMARDSPICIPGNDTLALITDKTERGVQDILGELENAGKISRVYTLGKKKVRIAILLLERIDSKLPHIPPERVDQAASACRKIHAEHEESYVLSMMKSSLSSMQKSSPQLGLSGTKTKPTTTKISGSSSSCSPFPSQDGEKAGEAISETEAERDDRVKAEHALSLAFPEARPLRLKNLVAEFGPETVMAASGTYRPSGRPSEWGWFRGICKNIRAEGGPVGVPAPPPARRADPEVRAFIEQAEAESEAKKRPPTKKSSPPPGGYHVGQPRPGDPDFEAQLKRASFGRPVDRPDPARMVEDLAEHFKPD